MAIVYLGLGSNLNNRENNIQRAFVELEKNNIQILKRSSIIETDPLGGPPQGKFLNAVIKIKTSLSPQDLLTLSKSIEQKLGRTETVVNGPRIIDIDILFYNEERIHTPQLTIPHPRMLERDFVMKPLKEIAPEIIIGLSYAPH